MADLDMTELQYAARGRTVIPGSPVSEVPGHILGMVSCLRGTLRKYHVESHSIASSHINSVLGPKLAGASSSNPGTRATATAAHNYIECANQYFSWDVDAGLEYRSWQLRSLINYSAGN